MNINHISKELFFEIESESHKNPIDLIEKLNKKFNLDFNKLIKLKNPRLKLIYAMSYYRNDYFRKASDLVSSAMNCLQNGVYDPFSQARLYCLKGNLCLEDGDIFGGLKNQFNALKLLKNNPDAKLEGRILQNIALNHIQERNIEKAEYFLKLALEKSESENDYVNIASIYQSIGTCKCFQDKYSEGEKYFEKALDIVKDADFKYIKLSLLINLGKAKFYSKKENDGIECLETAYKTAIEINSYKYQAWSLIYFSGIYLNIKDIKKVEKYLSKFESIIEKVNHHKPFILRKFSLQYMLEKLKGNFEKSLKAHEKYTDLRIKLVNEKIYAMQKEKEKEIEKLNYSIQLINIKNDKRKLETKLDIKNKELAAHLLKTVNFNSNLDEIKKELNLLKSKQINSDTQSFNYIESKLNQASMISSNLNWNDFEKKFKEVYTEFFHSISKKFPDLTKTEKKLCSLLKLQLSSKEISEILSISIGTVEVYRSRLRKKMGLNFKDNIHSFLDLI